MSLKISASTLFKYHYLLVTEAGVKYSETFGFSSVRRFPFNTIQAIVVSPKNVLSFQVGEEVFSIPFKPFKSEHQAALTALLEGVQKTDPNCKRIQPLPIEPA